MPKTTVARRRIDVTAGESVRIIRELQGFSQTQLSALYGIPEKKKGVRDNFYFGLGFGGRAAVKGVRHISLTLFKREIEVDPEKVSGTIIGFEQMCQPASPANWDGGS